MDNQVNTQAKAMGWNPADGEGALEYIMRRSYEQGAEDVRQCRSTHNEPPEALLISMAMRLNHGFALLTKRQQDAMLVDMRKVWEEVVGLGFYRVANAEFYTGMRKNHTEATIDAVARELYIKSTDSDTVHCNRFPAWEELTSDAKLRWQFKAETLLREQGADKS